jgi:hypothetical protein
MSDLTFVERNKLEKLFGMRSGYVLDFSNRTFAELVAESTGKDIYNAKYDYASGSKANRLRAFWDKEPNYIVSKLITDLLEYCEETSVSSGNTALHEHCRRIASRLQQELPVPEIDSILPNSGEKDFEILARSVRDAIERNQPEEGLDRLHTFVMKYMRVLCQKYGTTTEKEKPLHSLIGEYVRILKSKGLLESEMTERILKSSISVLESFNRVRNDQSLAHDNPMLNYDESLLIYNHITSSVKFIASIEKKVALKQSPSANTTLFDDDIPF